MKKKKTTMNNQSINDDNRKPSAEPNRISTTLLADLSNPILPNMDERESKGEANRDLQSPSHFKQQFEEQKARTQAQNVENEQQKDKVKDHH